MVPPSDPQVEVPAADDHFLSYRLGSERCSLRILPEPEGYESWEPRQPRRKTSVSIYSYARLNYTLTISRFGTAFSFISQISLTTSVWTVYTQLLWRTVAVQSTEMSVTGYNAAFGADTSVFSLLNLEILSKMRLGSAMGLFAWWVLNPAQDSVS